jgi:hypothetical protein
MSGNVQRSSVRFFRSEAKAPVPEPEPAPGQLEPDLPLAANPFENPAATLPNPELR